MFIFNVHIEIEDRSKYQERGVDENFQIEIIQNIYRIYLIKMNAISFHSTNMVFNFGADILVATVRYSPKQPSSFTLCVVIHCIIKLRPQNSVY